MGTTSTRCGVGRGSKRLNSTREAKIGHSSAPMTLGRSQSANVSLGEIEWLNCRREGKSLSILCVDRVWEKKGYRLGFVYIMIAPVVL